MSDCQYNALVSEVNHDHLSFLGHVPHFRIRKDDERRNLKETLLHLQSVATHLSAHARNMVRAFVFRYSILNIRTHIFAAKLSMYLKTR